MASEATLLERRGLLRGLVTLPLIGGGVTLIGRPGVRLPLQDIAAAPLIDDPRQRALYAWEAFAAAMRDVSAGATGWHVTGGERVQAVAHLQGNGPWFRARAYDTVPMDARDPNGLIDVDRRIEL